MIAAAEPAYAVRTAIYDIGSTAPRCARHWRYVCGACGRSAHFAATAFCSARQTCFCSDCAGGTREVAGRFFAWDYHFEYRSPWTGAWQPALDRLEFEGRLPTPTRVAHETYHSRYANPAPQSRASPAPNSGDVRSIWNENAARWDADQADDGDDARRYASDDVLLRFLGPVAGCDVLDVGCGNGYLCRRLTRQGARVVGVELSERMVDIARRHERAQPLGAQYVTASACELSCFDDASFDRIVSSYVLTSIPDYVAALAEARRLLRTGGRLVVVISHPCFSCGPGRWEAPVPDSPRPEELSALCVDDYFVEAPYLMAWSGYAPVPYFHRPLREYWHAIRAAGLDVVDFDEPGLSPRARSELPGWRTRQMARIPISCAFQLSARASSQSAEQPVAAQGCDMLGGGYQSALGRCDSAR